MLHFIASNDSLSAPSESIHGPAQDAHVCSTRQATAPETPTRTPFQNTLIEETQRHRSYACFCTLLKIHKIDPAALTTEVFEQIAEVMYGVQPDRRYLSADLTFRLWPVLKTNGQHRAIGICVSMLVGRGLLPLVCITPKPKAVKRYVLASPDVVDTWFWQLPPETQEQIRPGASQAR